MLGNIVRVKKTGELGFVDKLDGLAQFWVGFADGRRDICEVEDVDIVMPSGIPGTANPPATLPFIGQGEDSERLYRAEDEMEGVVYKVASELGRLLNSGRRHGEKGYWEKTMVETLASVLDSYSPSTAEAAAAGYLMRHGYVVFKPTAKS